MSYLFQMIYSNLDSIQINKDLKENTSCQSDLENVEYKLNLKNKSESNKEELDEEFDINYFAYSFIHKNQIIYTWKPIYLKNLLILLTQFSKKAFTILKLFFIIN
jgi:hypothetical protein